MPPSPTQQDHVTPQALRLVRLALMLSPLLCGAAFAFVTMQSGPILEDDPELARMVRLVFLGITVAAALGIAVIRRQHSQASTYQRQATLCIVGWGLGETAALFGAVYLLLFGSGVVFLLGLLVIGAAFVLFPLPSPSRA